MVGETMTNDLVVTEQTNPYAIMPVLDVALAANRRQLVIDYTKRMMVKGVDYGVVPGTGDKPTLLKPGAEKLASMFGLRPDFEPIETVLDWTGENHDGEPFFFMRYRCTLYRGDMAVGQGVGSCNSWEKKYRFRNVPLNKATDEDKANGRLETRKGRGDSTYKVYVVKNPDPADVVNTIDKMAQKRALVAAVLIAVNASELFTQDVEDYSDIVDADWTPAPAPAQAKPHPPTPIVAAPIPDDELVITEASAKEFPAAAAALLNTDTEDLKARMKALGYTSIPGKPAERVAAYRKLRDAQPTQPALVTDDPDAQKAAADTAAGLFD